MAFDFSSGLFFVAIAVNTWLLVKTSYSVYFTPMLPASSDTQFDDGIDLLMPVRNEENRYLSDCLRAFTHQNVSQLRLVVTDDRSTDNSKQVIQSLASQSLHELSLIEGKEPEDGWMGKIHALEQAKSSSSSKWLVLADADILPSQDLVSSAINFASENKLDALCVLPNYWYQSFWLGIALPVMSWISIMRVSPTETNRLSSSKAFGFGNFIVLRREAHDDIGGFESYKGAILDDCELFIRLKSAGKAILVVDGRRFVDSPMYDTLRELYLGFSKNSFAAINYNWFLLVLFLAMEVVGLLYPISRVATGHQIWLIPFSLMLCSMIVAGVKLRAPMQYYVLFPLGHLVAIAVLFNSAISHILNRPLRWKDRVVQGSEASRN